MQLPKWTTLCKSNFLLHHVPGCPYAKEREAIPGFIGREAARLALNAGEPTSRGAKVLCSTLSRKTSQSPNIDRRGIYNTTYYHKNVYSLTSSKRAEFSDEHLQHLAAKNYEIGKRDGRTLIVAPYAKN